MYVKTEKFFDREERQSRIFIKDITFEDDSRKANSEYKCMNNV